MKQQPYKPLGTSSLLQAGLSRRKALKRMGAGGFSLAALGLIACGTSNSNNNTSSNAPAAKPTIASIGAASASPATGAGSATAAAAVPSAAAVTKHISLTAGISAGSEGTTLSPNSSAQWGSALYALYDQLARLTTSNELAPALALSWTNETPTRWVFKLRDTKWSDGQPFTADDVKYSFDYYADPNNKSSILARVSTVDKVEVIDPHTVAINTQGPDPVFLRRGFLIHILPKHILADANQGDQALATKGIGTGAYMIDSYTQGQEIKLKLNPTSWRGTRGVDGVDLKIIPDDSTRMAALQSQEVDLVDGVPYSEIARIQGFKNVAVAQTPATGYQGWDLEYFNPPWNDKRVRLAINQAMDFNAIAKTVYYGVPKVMQGQQLSSATFGFNPNLKPFGFDPQAAKQLLAAAGANNLTVKMEYVGTTAVQKALAEACADFLKQVGITVNITPIDINVWRDGLYGRRHRGEMMVDSWSASAALDASISLQWMLSDNPGKFYNNADFDAAYHSAVTEIDDNKRKAFYQKAAEVENGDPPGAWIVETPAVVAYRSDKIANFKAVGAPPIYYDELTPA